LALGHEYVSGYNSLAILGTYGVIIGNNCVGVGLYYGFSALIISYPGALINKAWFIPLGVFLIVLINSFRVVALCTNAINPEGYLQMESHDLFNNIIYVVIFLLWNIWIRVINKKSQVN
jgi:exosortase/archaeosortase family protein